MTDYKIQMHAPYQVSADFGKEALKLNALAPKFDLIERTKESVDKAIAEIVSFFCGGDESLREHVTVECCHVKKWAVRFKGIIIGTVEIITEKGVELKAYKSKYTYYDLKKKGAAI